MYKEDKRKSAITARSNMHLSVLTKCRTRIDLLIVFVWVICTFLHLWYTTTWKTSIKYFRIQTNVRQFAKLFRMLLHLFLNFTKLKVFSNLTKLCLNFQIYQIRKRKTSQKLKKKIQNWKKIQFHTTNNYSNSNSADKTWQPFHIYSKSDNWLRSCGNFW